MILVEADAGEEWDSSTDWRELADQAVRAAIAASRYAMLANSPMSVEVSVRFTEDAEVRALNAAYRNKDKATNVLSFPMVEPELIGQLTVSDAGEMLLGDIALARGVCEAEAEDKGVAVSTHATHLVVHGVLHLLGYDHETSEEDAEAMEDVEREALAALGIADPYEVTEVHT